MKSRDIAFLVLAVLILGVAGYIGYGQLKPKSASAGTNVEVIGVIKSDFDQNALTDLKSTKVTQDYTPAIDLRSGLNNAAPFGQ